MKALVGFSDEFIFQIINTVLFVGILALIIYGVFRLIKMPKRRKISEDRILKLENRISELEEKVNK